MASVQFLPKRTAARFARNAAPRGNWTESQQHRDPRMEADDCNIATRVPTGWWLFGATVIDDRGRPFRFGRGTREERQAARARLAKLPRPQVPPRKWTDSVGLILSFATASLIVWNSWERHGTLGWAELILLGVVVSVSLLSLTKWSALPIGPRVAIEAANRLARGCCGACSYDLGELKRGELSICSECGAAWKLNAPLSERVSE